MNGTSALTLFAPTNSAFAKVGNETLDGLLKDPDALSGVLQRHLVANKAVRWIRKKDRYNENILKTFIQDS